MKILLLILISGTLGSIGAVAGASLLLLFPDGIRKNLVPSLLAYAAGNLLGAAFLGMIPSALMQGHAQEILASVLLGIILFFLLEKLIIWRHCHDRECDIHGAAGPLILIGDAFHNFVDGIVIAAAFLMNIPLGIATALAVISHEIPQEIGDFAILLEGGFSKTKAMCFNTLSSLATLPGALIAYFFLKASEAALPYILSISAASFIYIAMADLIPQLHKRVEPGIAARQFLLFLLGTGTMLIFGLDHA